MFRKPKGIGTCPRNTLQRRRMKRNAASGLFTKSSSFAGEEPLPAEQEVLPFVMNGLVVLSQFDRIYRTGLLAETAVYAAQGVDFVAAGITGTVVPFPDFQGDAARGADGDAQAAGHAGGFPLGVPLEIMQAPPARRYRPFLLRVPDRHRRGEKTLQGQPEAFQHGEGSHTAL